MTETIREKFVRDWGEFLATKIEEAANSHRDGINDAEIGDPFQWALLICIGYQCLEKPEYRKSHGIPPLNWRKLKKWIKDNAELGTYRGSYDYIAAFAGTYNYFVARR